MVAVLDPVFAASAGTAESPTRAMTEMARARGRQPCRRTGELRSGVSTRTIRIRLIVDNVRIKPTFRWEHLGTFDLGVNPAWIRSAPLPFEQSEWWLDLIRRLIPVRGRLVLSFCVCTGSPLWPRESHTNDTLETVRKRGVRCASHGLRAIGRLADPT